MAAADASTSKFTCRPNADGCSSNQVGTPPPAAPPPGSSPPAVPPRSGSPIWSGANSYFLWALSSADQDEILSSFIAAGVKVVRIFITGIAAGAKGSSAVEVNQLESTTVGVYDDKVLQLVDDLMVKTFNSGIKLNIVFHDRYMIDCTWGCDAYAYQWGAYTTYQNGATHDVSAWYQNANFASEYENRMLHIVNHVNPTLGRAWKDLPEAIFGFGIQNEGQAHSPIGDPNWVCNRATFIKANLAPGINVLTGGGADVPDSILSQHISCPAIDVISVHSYDSGAWSRSDYLQLFQQIVAGGKRAIVEEFGASGSGKASSLAAQISQITNSWGVPSFAWQVMKPSNPNDYEFFTDQGDVWSAFTSAIADASGKPGTFSWPEII
ncbi:glycoside hydrolase family 5 protein [Gonapodya prolifera JEL478]|uniref:Glycoside hydrolase family 5 protein n=1 Tax=Gonapodya prolifera (strain JEL478) TaxID=1344416 RepID=A0A139AQU0_GONPJ|nr:glycoside hydrolase family 5 protein [Gonapodya prolifera JEL478]|eukprot:KXS19082.1 glycoside hydrolase family 5 protein [Gonapodya prolifera JEL478]